VIYIGLACDDWQQVAIKLEHETICPQIFTGIRPIKKQIMNMKHQKFIDMNMRQFMIVG